MSAPAADPALVARALRLHCDEGVPLPEAARRVGISTSTLKRAKAARPGGAQADDASRQGPAGELLAEIDGALADLPDVPEARVIGATLRMLAARTVELDAGRIPQLAPGIRTLALSLKDMRPPPAPPPDLVEERLREHDGKTRQKIERYNRAADEALEQRLGALRAWGTTALTPGLTAELGRHLDGLFAPP